jgi:hypothetical protein
MLTEYWTNEWTEKTSRCSVEVPQVWQLRWLYGSADSVSLSMTRSGRRSTKHVAKD